MNFSKFVRAPILQNITERLLLIIAVSIAVKGVFTNETVNYDTKTKAHVPIPARSASYQKREVLVKSKQTLKAVIRRGSSK